MKHTWLNASGPQARRFNAEDTEETRRSQRRPELRVLCASSANSAFKLEDACGVSDLFDYTIPLPQLPDWVPAFAGMSGLLG
jgi:hypothetical protein